MLLGVLSIVGGWVGIGNRFEHFLDPVIQKVSVEQSAAQIGEATAARVSQAKATGESKGTETLLMAISVLVAFSGLGLAWFLYVKNPELPAKIAAASGGLYRLVLNKYWIDELYSAVIIGPLVAFSRVVLWQTVDQKVIDGTVNESAVAARDVSQDCPPTAIRPGPQLRRMDCRRCRGGGCLHGLDGNPMNLSTLNPWILTLTTFLPALGALLIAFLPRRDRDIRWFAMAHLGHHPAGFAASAGALSRGRARRLGQLCL